MPVRYTRVGWQDAPSTETPISAANLNHMDNGILALSEALDTEIQVIQERQEEDEGQINAVKEDLTANYYTKETMPKPLWVNFGMVTELPATYVMEGITDTMECAEMRLDSPGAQVDDWSILTFNGSVRIVGTISGPTTIKLKLEEVQASDSDTLLGG